MKRTVIIICTISVLVNCSFAQSLKKPSLMILPSDNWCTERYFVQRFDNQGTITDMVDYERAFKEDIELPTVISTIGGFLAEKGYAVKDAEQAAKNLRANIAESNAVSSKSGYGLAENTLDIIKNKVKADILIQISWTFLNSNIQYTIESFDCYSGFRIPATITGFWKKDKSSIVSVLEKDISRMSILMAMKYLLTYDAGAIGIKTSIQSLKENLSLRFLNNGWVKILLMHPITS